MRPRSIVSLAVVATALFTACGDAAAPTAPTDVSGSPQFAKGGNAAPLAVSPGAVQFLLPNAAPVTVTVSVQYVGMIAAASSDEGCATVSPASTPASKPKGSSVYEATFEIAGVDEGECTITMTDKRGVSTQVAVVVATPPDGRIVFQSDRDGRSQLYVMDAAGGGQTRLSPDAGISEFHASFSGDGAKIAFISQRDINSEVYVMNSDGTGPTRLTSTVASETFPTFGGGLIAFGRSLQHDGSVWVMNADGTDQRQLTDSGDDGEPSISPDGSRVVFSSSRDGDAEIYLVNVDGTGLVRLTTSPGTDNLPSFSPDGAHITFSSHRDGNAEVYIMNADGSGQTRLTDDPAPDFLSSFSSDGHHIVFESDRSGDREIHVMKRDGSLTYRVTNEPGIDGVARFGP